MEVFVCVRGVRGVRGVHSARALARAGTGARKNWATNRSGDVATGISAHEINAISSSFVARTRDLEPGIEVKQVSQIRAQFQERYDARYLRPSKQWLRQSNVPRNRYLINENAPAIRARELQFDVRALARTPLKSGDMVLLQQHPNELSMCVDVPGSSSDPRYTFASVDGTLRFASRSSVLLRIPNGSAVPMPLLVREKQHAYEPIGTIKNSVDETFILPTAARQSVTSALPQHISKCAWNQLPTVLRKLESLHRELQNFRGPVSFPFVHLVQLVQKSMNVSPALRELDSAIFLATYWGLKSQQKSHLWGEIQLHKALLSPISVTVLPFDSRHVHYTRVEQRLKSDNYKEINDFAELANANNASEITTRYPHVIALLKDYASGNLQNIESIISLIARIFRKIDRYKDNDITRDCCHELLTDIVPKTKLWNPMHANVALGLPSSSPLTRTQQKIYDLSRPKADGRADAFERFDFGDLNVYCIDADDAHEIDDGVSIRDLGNNRFTLYIHIADPASLFVESREPDSSGIKDEILEIASKKCFTTYLPDIVVPMLPKSYCGAADLGKQGQQTKTVTFSIDAVIDPNDESVNVLDTTFQVRLGHVAEFPKVSYDVVDSILKKGRKVPHGKQTTEQKELQKLHLIAKLLRDSRVKKMGAVIFGDGFNKGLVQISKDDNQTISFESKTETDSVVLVTEMMILANTLSGKYFSDNKIPGIFRSYQPLILGVKAQNEYDGMRSKIKDGILPTYRDIALLASLLNSSFYSAEPYNHEMIGASQYLTVTSPLRRFPDLVNHLQIHRFLRGLPTCFSQAEIIKLLDDIQSRDSILKSASRQGASYWTLKFLKDSLACDGDQRFAVMVTSVPQVGLVRCVLPDYPSARGTLRLKPTETNFPAIGDTVVNCKITKIDCLDGILELQV